MQSSKRVLKNRAGCSAVLSGAPEKLRQTGSLALTYFDPRKLELFLGLRAKCAEIWSKWSHQSHEIFKQNAVTGYMGHEMVGFVSISRSKV